MFSTSILTRRAGPATSPGPCASPSTASILLTRTATPLPSSPFSRSGARVLVVLLVGTTDGAPVVVAGGRLGEGTSVVGVLEGAALGADWLPLADGAPVGDPVAFVVGPPGPPPPRLGRCG